MAAIITGRRLFAETSSSHGTVVVLPFVSNEHAAARFAERAGQGQQLALVGEP